MNNPLPTLAVVGGTGALGSALARRWASAGYNVIIGSRTIEKAASVAAGMAGKLDNSKTIQAMDNVQAADRGDIVILAVPFQQRESILTAIASGVAGKIVVDTSVPLAPPKVGTVQLPAQGSAAQMTQAFFGAGVTVLSAFQNVAAAKLAQEGEVDCDVLVCGDSAADRERLIELVAAAGLRGLHAGPLANSAAVEALTSVLITINRRYKIAGAGIRITGLPADA